MHERPRAVGMKCHALQLRRFAEGEMVQRVDLVNALHHLSTRLVVDLSHEAECYARQVETMSEDSGHVVP